MRIFVLILMVAFGGIACGSDESKPAEGFDLKDEYRDKNDGTDYCDEFNWYGDGECDEFCANPDPDCQGVNSCEDVECCVDLPHPAGCCEGVLCDPPECPEEGAPDVSYWSYDVSECNLIDRVCDGEYFEIQGCGCGCIGSQTPPPPTPFCPTEAEVDYLPGSQENYQEICENRGWACAGTEAFSDPQCGCGCFVGQLSCLDPGDPNVEYVGESIEQCTLIDYVCEPDEEYFADDCGCGCVGRSECLDSDDPNVEYISDQQGCAVLDWGCAEGERAFENQCGCGCVADDGRPDYCDNPLLNYVAEDPAQCAAIFFACPEGEQHFEHPECGCGCYENPPTCLEDIDCKPGYCDPVPQVIVGDTLPALQPVCYPTECSGDGSMLLCDALEPDCPGAEVAVVENGCWECVDPRTCK